MSTLFISDLFSHLKFNLRVVDFNTKLRKILNESNLTLSLLNWFFMMLSIGILRWDIQLDIWRTIF
jgi:hypothetical protein